MPIANSYIIAVKAQWQYIAATLKAEQNVGLVNGYPTPNTGTNPTGRLPTVLTVGSSTWPSFNALPYVGVMPGRVTGSHYAAKRRDLIEIEMQMVGVVSVVAQGENVLLLDDAMAKLVDIIDDGAGNGLQPIMRSNMTLGANAWSSIISAIDFGWDKSPGSGSDYVAYANMIVKSSTFAQQ